MRWRLHRWISSTLLLALFVHWHGGKGASGAHAVLRPVAAQRRVEASGPTIYFTDLLSGPASGGQNENGAFVTIYGTGFGDHRESSFVTLGSSRVALYPFWSNRRIIIQLAPHDHSGPLQVHVSVGTSNADHTFTVRPGRLLYVSTRGSDRGDGSFSHPWRTLLHAKDSLRPGDILYAGDGVKQTKLDAYESALSIQTSGRPDDPIAIVAYPRAHVIIGAVDGPRIAARTPNIDRTSDHWVLAGLEFRGDMQALDLTASRDWRIIGNDFTCPAGFGPDGCVEVSQSSDVAFVGNNVHDIALRGTTKAYHAVYFSTDSHTVDVGFNTIARVHACRALQFHSTPLDPGTGKNMYGLYVHDNIIHDVACDGINFATVDPSRGPVIATRNLLYRVGTGPDPQDGSADYACIYVQGGANAGRPGSGDVLILDNTLYDCGSRRNTDSGAIALGSGSPAQHVLLRGNIIVLQSGVPFLTPNSITTPLHAEENILWGGLGAPAVVRSGLHQADPYMASPAQARFQPAPYGPADHLGAPPDVLQRAAEEAGADAQ